MEWVLYQDVERVETGFQNSSTVHQSATQFERLQPEFLEIIISWPHSLSLVMTGEAQVLAKE